MCSWKWNIWQNHHQLFFIFDICLICPSLGGFTQTKISSKITFISFFFWNSYNSIIFKHFKKTIYENVNKFQSGLILNYTVWITSIARKMLQKHKVKILKCSSLSKKHFKVSNLAHFYTRQIRFERQTAAWKLEKLRLNGTVISKGEFDFVFVVLNFNFVISF